MFRYYREQAQSNELTRGPPEFGHMGSSQRRKSAACPKFYMVWLYVHCPAYPNVEDGGNFSSFN
jgi:hypothetical protein